VTANEEYGGLGMGYQAHCVVMEEISRASGMSPSIWQSENRSNDSDKKEASDSLTPPTPSSA
jgi:hypothetical protein